jgi:hypothetical protein
MVLLAIKIGKLKIMKDSILEDALSLKRANNQVVKFVVEFDIDELSKALQLFSDLKKKIKTTLIENPIAIIHDHSAQDVLKKIQQEEPFQADVILKNLIPESERGSGYDELQFEELDELQDLLYTWFSHHEYVRGLYDIGSLIIGITIPQSLKTYVSEARQCYAFQQYNAVYGLCRTILETAIRHRCERKGLIKKQNENVIDYFQYKPSDLINKCTHGDVREKVKDIYKNTSGLLHGRKTVNSDDTKKMFKDTLKVVQTLYSN